MTYLKIQHNIIPRQYYSNVPSNLYNIFNGNNLHKQLMLCVGKLTIQSLICTGHLILFQLVPMGSSLPGLRTLDPPLRPPSTLAEIFRHPCLQSGLRPSKRSKFSPFSGQNRVILGGRGGPRNFFSH